jgi:aminoglycoside phosphotransferase (APT) family kinase protein
VEVLGAYFSELVGGFDGPLRARLLAGGRSNSTYALTDDTRQWVLHRPPYGLILKSAHGTGREVTVLQCWAEPTTIPLGSPAALTASQVREPRIHQSIASCTTGSRTSCCGRRPSGGTAVSLFGS